MLSQVLSLTIFGGPLTVLTVEQALKSDQTNINLNLALIIEGSILMAPRDNTFQRRNALTN